MTEYMDEHVDRAAPRWVWDAVDRMLEAAPGGETVLRAMIDANDTDVDDGDPAMEHTERLWCVPYVFTAQRCGEIEIAAFDAEAAAHFARKYLPQDGAPEGWDLRDVHVEESDVTEIELTQ